MIIIPGIVIFNTWVFSQSFKNTVDQSLQNKGVEIGQAVNTALADKLDSPEQIQSFIDNWTIFNEDTKAFDIFYKKGDTFVLVASLDKEKVGQVVTMGSKDDSGAFYMPSLYGFAWNENSTIAQKIVGTTGTGESVYYWAIVNPLKGLDGEKKALMSIRISTGVVDESLSLALIKSYIILFLTVIAIIMLLLANSRLFEYTVLYNKIKEVDKMKDEFISMASHELRTPVTVIRGYISMILEETKKFPLNEGLKEYLIIIRDSTERLNGLIEDLLNVSRIEQNRLKMEPVALNAWPIVEETVKEFKVQAGEKKLELICLKDSNIIDYIKIDKDRFKQILINVIGNAIKYTPSGSIEIEGKNKDNYLILTIKDTGIGMTAKEREHLFEKFYRVKNKKTDDVVGTGLGLWITKQIVELMNGSISVDSIEEVGTQFTIEIPLITKK
jgi:signal transduction histidine kinase